MIIGAVAADVVLLTLFAQPDAHKNTCVKNPAWKISSMLDLDFSNSKPTFRVFRLFEFSTFRIRKLLFRFFALFDFSTFRNRNLLFKFSQFSTFRVFDFRNSIITNLLFDFSSFRVFDFSNFFSPTPVISRHEIFHLRPPPPPPVQQ